MVSVEVNLRNVLLMSGSSILILPLISVPHYLLPTGSMETSNAMLIANESGRWNMPRLFCLFCQPLGGLAHEAIISGFSFVCILLSKYHICTCQFYFESNQTIK